MKSLAITGVLLLVAITTLAQTQVLEDVDFEIAQEDIENSNDCVAEAPWGDKSWGIEAATFTTDTRALNWSRFTTDEEDAYLYGLETDAEWGFVRYVQGDVWGGHNCGGQIPWNVFDPISTYNADITINLDYYLDTVRIFDDAWLMFAVNIWFTSFDFTEGMDKFDRKPLVMDLVLYQTCNIPDCRIRNFEDDAAFHYMDYVAKSTPAEWHAVSIDLAEHIENAFETDYLDECANERCHGSMPVAAIESLALHQVEFVIELHNSEGAASIDNFVVTVDE